jgi:hypothetical protein
MHRTLRASFRRQLFVFVAVVSLVLLSNPFPQIIFASSRVSAVPDIKTHALTQQPNKQSLLIVLLDRSGSLVDGSTPTDPDHYSTSVARALTDLWPGKMVVITFPQVNPLVIDKVGQLGPYDLTDSTQRQSLKNRIVEADPNGNTPLGPAMDTALHILQGGPVPPGSQAIIITDGLPNMSGDPTGSQETAHIENNLLSQFHQLGVPINTFGLKITSQGADNLLTTIAHRTGANYTPVQSSTELSQQVIQLCASWLGLSFRSATADNSGNYAININELTNKAQIIIFRSKEQYPITITAPDRSILAQGAGVQQSLDIHYQIDMLDVTPPIASGTYNVFVGKDSDAQVYWLTDTRLQVYIKAPSSKDVVYTGLPSAKVTAELLDGNNAFSPKRGAVLRAYITFTAPGQVATTSEVDLLQQNGQDIFSGNAPIYNTSGTLQIVVKANYEEIHQQSNAEIVKVEIPIHPCATINCAIKPHLALLIIGAVLLLLLIIGLILYLIWRKQEGITGYLINARSDRKKLKLGTYRSLSAKLFKKSVITVQELSQHPQGALVAGTLLVEPLAFVATSAGISLRAMDGDLSHISIRTPRGEQAFDAQKREISLGSRSEILRNNIPEVIFQLAMSDTRSATSI